MPTPFRWLAALALLGTTGIASAEACTMRSGPALMPLVELYTSEGCSSCPPADRWLSSRFMRGDANYLAFHVDYWDSIGWPDRFADASFSRRQRERVSSAGRSAVFTPQVMVGSAVQADWRSPLGLGRTLSSTRAPARAGLSMQLDGNGDGLRARVGAAPVGSAPAGTRVWLARYVDGQSAQVPRGENAGRTLRHDRVVTQVFGPWALSDAPLARDIQLPVANGAWGLTAVVQAANGEVLQSLDLAGSGCKRG